MAKKTASELIDALGGTTEVARICGVRPASVSEWRQRDTIPVGRCVALEIASAGTVTRYDLRPDVFGEAPAADLREAG